MQNFIFNSEDVYICTITRLGIKIYINKMSLFVQEYINKH